MASRIEQKERARAARMAAEEAERRSARRRTSLLRLGLVLGLAAVVVVVAVVVSSGGNDTKTPGSGGGSAAVADVNALFKGIPQDGITLGDPKAKTTLVEFADLQCPYCAQYNDKAMPAVVKQYVRSGRLQYELRLRSFLGNDSTRAAGAAAVAAKENRLFQFADLFYRRQGEENTGYVTADFIRGVAEDAGVDPDAAVRAADDPGGQPLVAEAEQKAADLGSTSTPDFYLRLASGRMVPVPVQDLTADAVTSAIDKALPNT